MAGNGLKNYILSTASPLSAFKVPKFQCFDGGHIVPPSRLSRNTETLGLIGLIQVNLQGFVFLHLFLEIHTRSRGDTWSTKGSFVGNMK